MGLWYCTKCNALTNVTTCPKCGKATEGAYVADFNTSYTFIGEMEEDNWKPMEYKRSKE